MSEDHPAGLLVFGDDGSTHADVAWRWVENQPWPGWQVDVLTATPPDSALWSWDEAPGPVPWEPPQPRALPDPTAVAGLRHLTAAADPRVLLGHQHQADLVVVGPRGLGEVRALLVGGTTEWLVRHPPAPVAVVRSPDPVRRVLACVDGSPHAQAALEGYLRLPRSGDPEVIVMSTYDRLSDIDGGCDRALKALDGQVDDVSTVRAWGQATPAILQQIDQVRPDLVLMGTRGVTVWKRLLLGSTASAVVHLASCSVLVASADGQHEQHER